MIVGGGAVGVDFHLPRLRMLAGCEVVEVVEPDAERRAVLAQRFRGRRDLRLLAELPMVEHWSVAVIATPPRFHASYAATLAQRCDRLLIEKPLAPTVADAEAMVEVLDDARAQAFVCHLRRALGSFAFVRDARERGIFGHLREVRVAEGGVFGWRAASMGSFSRTLNGGGVLQDTGPHTLDLLLQVFDDLHLDAAWMDADLRSGERAIEANCELALRADDDVPVHVMLSRNRNLSNTARFDFEQATVTVDVRDNSLTVARAPGFGLRGVPLAGPGATLDYDALFDAFYTRFVVPGDNRGVTPRDALTGVRLIEAAYACAQPLAGGF